MAQDQFPPFVYALVGALIFFLCLQLWHYIRRRRPEPPGSASKSFDVHLIEDVSSRPHANRHWLEEKLTSREMQIAIRVADGKRNADIADELSISVRTVQTHVQNIYAKLEVHSRTELARVMRDLVD